VGSDLKNHEERRRKGIKRERKRGETFLCRWSEASVRLGLANSDVLKSNAE